MNFFRVLFVLKIFDGCFLFLFIYLFVCLFVFSILVKFNCLICEKWGFSKMSLGRLHSWVPSIGYLLLLVHLISIPNIIIIITTTTTTTTIIINQIDAQCVRATYYFSYYHIQT